MSLISSSENPLHSPSDSSLDEDADDLLGDDDGYCITPVECGGLENTPKPSALDSTVDFLYGQNPLLSPSSSMAASSMELDRDESLGAGEVVSVQVRSILHLARLVCPHPHLLPSHLSLPLAPPSVRARTKGGESLADAAE